MRFNGWQRLWIVVSVIWICAVAAIGYLSRPAEFAPHHPAFYYQLAPASQALLLTGSKYGGVPVDEFVPTSLPNSDSTSSPAEVEMPNGHVLRFRSDSSREDQERVAREYHQITVEAQSSIRIENIRLFTLLAIVPCAVLGLIGFSFAWVRRGFKESNRAEP